MSRIVLRLLVAVARSLPRRRHWRRRTASSSQEFQFRAHEGGNDEFVELLNTSSAPVDISGWRLQGCAGRRSRRNGATVPAGITLGPGHQRSSATRQAPTPPSRTRRTPRASTTAARRSSSCRRDKEDAPQPGRIGGRLPRGNGLAIPTANGDNAFERKDEGRQDTDSNLEDFAGPKVGNPQPFGSPPEPPPATPCEIWEIQGTAHRLSLSGAES